MSARFIAAPEPRVLAAREAARSVFADLGAELVDPPVLQPARAYLDLAGEDVRRRLFLVDPPEGGESLCLRPDLTVPVCRLHLARLAAGRANGGAAAYRYEGKAFRFAPPESGRPSEFIQVGYERFQPDDEEAAEVEVLALAVEAVHRVGARLGSLIVGDTSLFAAFADRIGAPQEAAARLKRAFAGGDKALGATAAAPAPATPLALALAEMAPDAAARALDEIYALAGVTPVGGRPAREIADRLRAKGAEARSAELPADVRARIAAFAAVEGPPRAALDAIERLAREAGADVSDHVERWSRRLDRLAAAGAPLDRTVLSVGFARQFTYYGGWVFEARDPRLGPAQILAAGGRYDALPALLDAPDRAGPAAPTTAVGCALRPGRLAASAELGA